jgi:NAD(P)-dependent dehydrogenase (short-subunit alcohol dehydrogenase family)
VGLASYDFSGRRVLVAGGTRGVGLLVAHALADAGAEVSVTGTSSLVSYYDPSVARFGYRQVDLTDGDEIAALADRLGALDVLVNAAAPRISTAADAAEREFLAQAARLTLIGPFQLATRLRLRMAASEMSGGGSIVNLPATRGWFALAAGGHATGPSPDVELERTTQRLGSTWGRLGVRVNTVTAPLAVPEPRGEQPSATSTVARGDGLLLTRTTGARTLVEQQVVDLSLFLASSASGGLSGQTFPVGAIRR